MAGVPVVPCAIVGSTHLWFRRRVVVRFGPPIAVAAGRSTAARDALDAATRAAIVAMLPTAEPRLPRRRPLRFLGDLLTGADDLAARRAELGD
jgi:1-acyl-sn-glycerol-3-phosphate acyltransferase